MRILFVHQNFPGQFKHLAPALAADPANTVVAFTMTREPSMQRVRVILYKPAKGTSGTVHPWVSDFETKVIRAEAVFRTALKLREEGFSPDVIYAHHGWGESLFLKDVWPRAKLLVYCEFYYHAHDFDLGFDPEFPASDPGEVCRLRLKNLNNLLHFECSDAGISPTRWQRSTFPEPFRSKIEVVHDGIDTDALVPAGNAYVVLNGDKRLDRSAEIITFASRSLEPYRGYHMLMRALPEVLRRRPKARVLIVGANGVSYGATAPDGKSWKDIYLNEVRHELDLSRVHFLGTLPYNYFVPLLQVSTVHVYLTYPFVLSWSLLEAMSCGCAIVASDTQPLREAVTHGETGRLVNFFDVDGLADQVCDLLERPEERARLGTNARAFARANYDLKTVCLPRQVRLILAG